ncbi:IDEAL domain-containing protein [Bacillus songklensis]|uniref:IDEAL domain-containing protein n=1 Tax=Bacillus songklensis TaxID=1069116 RepID=A0ABV8B093_9BACI
MKHEKSYTEMMKSLAHAKMEANVRKILDVYIDMVIDESIFLHQKERLESQINDALDMRDKQQFELLSTKYKTLLAKAT